MMSDQWITAYCTEPCRMILGGYHGLISVAQHLISAPVIFHLKFAYMMKKVPSPFCYECGIIEVAVHIMVKCVRNFEMNISEIKCCI